MKPEINNKYNVNEDDIDVKKYIILILGNWWLFGLTIFISFTVAYLINRYSQEEYRASCSIIIGEDNVSEGMESILQEFSRKNQKRRKAIVENEISILKSYKLARIALEELNFGITYTEVGRRNIAQAELYKKSPFVVIPDSNSKNLTNSTFYIQIISPKQYKLYKNESKIYTMNFGEPYNFNNESFTVKLADPINFQLKQYGSNKYFFTFNDINTLSNSYSKKLSIKVNDEKGSVITMSMSGKVPNQITDYLNKLSEIYIRENIGEKNLISDNTINFIDNQLHGIVDSLEATGLRLQKFRSVNKVIDLSQEGSFLFNQIQSLQSEQAALDLQSRYYNYLLEYVNEKTDYSDIIAPSVVGINDQLLSSLVNRLNESNLERRNQKLVVQDDSPQLTFINNQISNTKLALQENLKSLIDGNVIARNDLKSRIEKIESGIRKLPGTERELINIQREFTINDQIYTFLLEKRAEAGIKKASNTPDHKLLDIAQPQNISLIKPKTAMNYGIAFSFGLLCPLLFLLLHEFFNTKITDRKLLESRLQVPIIANIGHNSEGTELPVNDNPRSSLTESFRSLRTNLQFILNKPDSKIIAVSSAVSGEGKTFCSVNLASILAMADKKVLLVSLDLRRPKVHHIFNLNNSVGLSTYLVDRSKYDDIVFETNFTKLFVAVAGPIPPNPSELIDSEKMKEFIKESKERFDYIVVDTPPISIVTDTIVMKSFIDTFVFVIRHGFSNKYVIDLVNDISRNKLFSGIGIIVNDIQLRGYYGYSYRYGYGYGYGYGYTYGYYNKSYYDESDSSKNRRFKFLKKLSI